jgi:ABC-type transport system involved in multi-copper enzyme maturation permease subunit
LGIVCFAWPFYELVGTRQMAVFIGAMVCAQVLQSLMFAPLGALLSEMFSTSVRYTGASMGYQLAALLGAGFTPLIASSVVSGGTTSTPLVALAACCGLVTASAIWRVDRVHRMDLADVGVEATARS